MANRLAAETSPYLRQHAANPVDWYPWGDEAFAAARATDRPIFLSVGYSSCHWCHVMAHESFEDPDTAALLNAWFVNVKVDREERPDVDAVYMQAVQGLTGRGGWPMSVFLAPDGRPFYGGTYWPADDRPGFPSFRRVAAAAHEAWEQRREELLAQAERVTDAIRVELPAAGGDRELSADPIAAARDHLRDQFDHAYGGFGAAPKFPPAPAVMFLCRQYVRDESAETLEMISTTLDAMAAGGIHDHAGGGFARYSTDVYWLVPHFEKMLYDNALLARAYLQGHLLTGQPRWSRVVEDTIGYVLRDLRHPEGGFFSAEDADSEGVEGKFYLWGLTELAEVCGDDMPEVVRYFGPTGGGNFVDPHTGVHGNILHAVDRTEPPPPAVERALERLRARRAQRPRPGLDDKVLLAWNALFLRVLAEAAAALERADWMDAARTNARFLLRALRRADGRFLRSWQPDAPERPGYGRARHLAYAEDYAALLEALCTLAETDDVAWLADARAVADALLDLFHDSERGGFFTTGHDAPALVVRPRDLQDGATPSASSMAADGLLRLAALTGETRYEEPARRTLQLLARPMAAYPGAFFAAVEALERAITPPLEVAVIGTPGDGRTAALRHEVHARVLPATVTLTAAPGTNGNPLLAARGLVGGAPAAYVCEGYACRRPVTDPAALRSELDAALVRRGAAVG